MMQFFDEWEDDEPRDDSFTAERDEPCIGAECVNPHDHGRDECETVEMHEAHMQDCARLDRFIASWEPLPHEQVGDLGLGDAWPYRLHLRVLQ